MTFYVGQKVVCVNDCNGGEFHPKLGAGYMHGLRNGSVYTITKISGDFLALAEIAEGGWLKERFRPAVERKTDISIFTKILDDVREHQSA